MKYIALLLVAALAGCSSYSTPLTDIYSIRAEDGVQRYRVTCSGLLGGTEVCKRSATVICEKSRVKVVGEPEPSAITFMCEAPQAAAR
ncbi:hypothetical protein WS70_17670 [Burkholderia mayonis]|uniref:Lipoprotein n=1 Tax=Burkholderia mayonis TaxID=1385591 RepID=A0A1B4FJD2_9BURK|nr:hypothetical protein [Burkholderia mayonis]AOJ03760.1 hypothetical protein WS70_17670 [Burkholderia mayonis]KVE44251.1 hypothetical protein WS70_00375 [Burkholderia mayonis]